MDNPEAVAKDFAFAISRAIRPLLKQGNPAIEFVVRRGVGALRPIVFEYNLLENGQVVKALCSCYADDFFVRCGDMLKTATAAFQNTDYAKDAA